jgi:hypothetical protein
MGVVLAMYFVNTVVFNLIHLRLKKEMVAWWSISTFKIYKLALSFVNAASVYWTIYEYATYFANKHFRIVDDPEALEVVTFLPYWTNVRLYGDCNENNLSLHQMDKKSKPRP